MRKFINRKILMLAIILSLTLLLGQYESTGLQSKSPVDKYAILVVAMDDTNADMHRNLDPIDVNVDIVTVSKIYKVLKGNGFKDENINILYAANDFDWDEKENNDVVREMKKNHFDGNKYDRSPTKKNIRDRIENFKGKVDDNDRFIFYIMTHGDRPGVMVAGGMWSNKEIQVYLSGFKSKSNIFVFGSCFSGSILKTCDFDNAVSFTITGSETPGWSDRTFCNSASFFQALANRKLDKNKNNRVDAMEAFEEAKRMAKEYEPKWRNYCKTKYKPDKPTPPGVMESCSIIPDIEIGKSYEEFDLASEKEPDKKPDDASPKPSDIDLGIGSEELSGDELGKLCKSGLIKKGNGGIKVTSVAEGSVAKSAGIKEGDIIITFLGQFLPEKDPLSKLQSLLSKVEKGKTYFIDIIRNGKKLSLKVIWPKVK